MQVKYNMNRHNTSDFEQLWHLNVRSREDLKVGDYVWLADREHNNRDACQNTELFDKVKSINIAFDISRNLLEWRLSA